MPRNGSGSYSLPQAPFTPGTTISSAAVNSDFSDIANALTASISADGQTPITGTLKQDSGTLALPPWTFTADTSAGMFLPAAGKVGLVVGSKGIYLNSVAITVTAAAVAGGGGNYAVGDSITLTGGTFLKPAVLQVATLSGSAVASVTVTDGGLYTAAPSNPVSQGSTSGGGSGATFNLTTASTSFGISTETGTSLWAELGASSYMAGLMSTVSASALQASLLGTTVSATVGTNQNNYSPAGIHAALVLRITPSSAITITGIDAATSFAGRQLTIENVGSNAITLTSNDANSTAANRFGFISAIVLGANQSLTLIYDTASFLWRSRNPIIGPTIVQNLSNLKITNNAGTPNSIMDITCDAIILGDSSGNTYRATGVSVSPNITVSGVNGLDTGTKANSTPYFIWVIYNPTTNTVAGLFSLQSSGSLLTLPSGYTFYARVGWNFLNSSGNFMGILQYGKRAQYVVGLAGTTVHPQVFSGSTASSWVAKSVVNFVPSTAAVIWGGITYNNIQVAAAPNGNYGVPTASSNGPPLGINTGTTQGNSQFSFVLESTNVYFWSASTAQLNCLGWEDNL